MTDVGQAGAERVFVLPAARDKKRITANRVFAVYFAVLAVWSYYAARHGHPVLGTIAAVMYVELCVVALRAAAKIGGVVYDAEAFQRVAPPLRELCAKARCPVPTVGIRDDNMRAAYVAPAKNADVLFISRGFLTAVDDRQLRGLIAHEVIHLAYGELTRLRRRSRYSRWFGAVVGGVVGVLATNGSNTVFPLAMAGVLVAVRLLAIPVSLANRKREVRADCEGAALAGDPEALAGALIEAYAMSAETRRAFYGAAPIRWLLWPVTWPLPTHPSKASRLERLRAMAATSSAA